MSAALARLRAALADTLDTLVDALTRTWPQVATVCLGLAGWALLTSAVAAVCGSLSWRVSLGLLCLSCFGWKLLFVIARDGLYTLTRPKGGAGR